MQTQDKKTGKIVSLQKNLEWSTKEVLGAACLGLGGWDIEGLGELWRDSILGNTLLGRLQVLVICRGGSERSWGKGPQPWGVRWGSSVCRPRHLFPPQKGTAIYREKEQEIKAGRGEQTAARRDFLVEGRAERCRVCSRLAPNRLSSPGLFCTLGCLLLFLFSRGLSKLKKNKVEQGLGLEPLDFVKWPKISAVRRLKIGATFVCLQLICPLT